MSQEVERESMEYDVVDRRRRPGGSRGRDQAEATRRGAGREISVCVLEKGSEIGAHILSGAVIDPIALNELIPDWNAKGRAARYAGHRRPVLYLGPAGSVRIPNFLMPRLMNNHGNYIASLGNVCRWLAREAEALGVEIYPGFPAADLVIGDKGEVRASSPAIWA